MTERNKKSMEVLTHYINSSTSEADSELLETMMTILTSSLTDNQKRLLLYFLHTELLNEIKKEKKTINRLRGKISKSSRTSDTQKHNEITRTATEFEKIRDIIGGILYDVVATEDVTDTQIEAFNDRFLNSGTWCGDSSASRKVANCLRGFKIKVDKD